MKLLDWAADFGLLPVGAILLLLLIAAKEVGYYIARRIHKRKDVDEATRTSIGYISGGMLALLAFLLAIALSVADRRYEERRNVVLAEANAIGTAWLRAGAQDSEAGMAVGRLRDIETVPVDDGLLG